MKSEKQRLILDYLISSPDLFVRVHSILKDEYFDPDLRSTAGYISEYYEKYKALPEIEQVEAETGIALTERRITPAKFQATIDEVEEFCKHSAVKVAMAQSIVLLNQSDYGGIRELMEKAILVGLDQDIGVVYFEDPKERLNRLLVDVEIISTGWRDVDNALGSGSGAGIAKKEMILFCANSGVGKSVTLMNLGYNFLRQKKDVLYISLELSQDIVTQRFDQLISGFNCRDGRWKDYIDEICDSIYSVGDNSGSLCVRWMRSETTVHQIKAYLQNYQLKMEKLPDLLIVDYLDKMSPNDKLRFNPSDVWTKDKYCSEQLRDLGVEYNMCIATASQLNRGAIKAIEHDQSHIAGGISKINETDVCISIYMDEQMRAQGDCTFSFLKTRNSDGVGRRIKLRWDAERLRLSDGDVIDKDKLKKKSHGATRINSVSDDDYDIDSFTSVDNMQL